MDAARLLALYRALRILRRGRLRPMAHGVPQLPLAAGVSVGADEPQRGKLLAQAAAVYGAWPEAAYRDTLALVGGAGGRVFSARYAGEGDSQRYRPRCIPPDGRQGAAVGIGSRCAVDSAQGPRRLCRAAASVAARVRDYHGRPRPGAAAPDAAASPRHPWNRPYLYGRRPRPRVLARCGICQPHLSGQLSHRESRGDGMRHPGGNLRGRRQRRGCDGGHGRGGADG